VFRGSLEDRAFVGLYFEAGEVKAVVGMNRGGDPEADDESELGTAKGLVIVKNKVDPAVLADEKVDLQSLTSAAERSA
jgi:hypothetical protein